MRIAVLGLLVLGACQTMPMPASNNVPCDKVGTSVSPGNVTYGYKGRTCKSDWMGYGSKESVTFEVKRGSPVYAITDMTLVRVSNLSAKRRRGMAPYDDIHLYFITTNGDKYRYYHMKSSPLAPSCPVWDTFKQARKNKRTSLRQCNATRYTNVKKGDLIGTSGATGLHEHFDIIFKPRINGRNHIVQGDVHFEWECGNSSKTMMRLPFTCPKT